MFEIFKELPFTIDRSLGNFQNILFHVTSARGFDRTRHVGNSKLMPCGAKTKLSFTWIIGGAVKRV